MVCLEATAVRLSLLLAVSKRPDPQLEPMVQVFVERLPVHCTMRSPSCLRSSFPPRWFRAKKLSKSPPQFHIESLLL